MGSSLGGLARRWAAARRRSDGLELWLAAALAAHAVLLATLAGPSPSPFAPAAAASARSQPSSPDATAPTWLELVEEHEPVTTPVSSARVAAAEPSPSAESRAPSRTAATGRPLAANAAQSSALSSLATRAEAPADEAPTGSASPEPGGQAAGADAEGSAPHLSLRDLGVGGGPNPFIGPPSEQPTERQRLNQRLRESLRGALARHDQTRGLGPEGPAVAAVKELVMASATAPNTTALLRVRADATGLVTLVEVLDADRDDGEWRRIAAELVRALTGKHLRVPPHSGGVSFQLRVVSRVQLPSGADPGLAVDLFGVPVRKGDGEKSTRLSLLSPMLQEVVVPGSDGATMRVPSLSILGLAGDVSDIGRVARRLVTAYLVAMDTETASDSAAAPVAPGPVPPGARPLPPAPTR